MIWFDEHRLDTPIGTLTLVVSERGVRSLDFVTSASREQDAVWRSAFDPHDAVGRLRAWFAGDLEACDGLPVDMCGTPFQELVWNALRRIAAGTTISYAELARRIGRPSAARAVARANAANRIAIVVPCHRVIGADGTLRGYACGIERKRWLLDHERAAVPTRA